MDLTFFIAQAFIFILPAYIANSTAALFGGRTPLDWRKKMRDGRRALGDGKTVLGLASGTFFGTMAAYFIGVFTFGSAFSLSTNTGFWLSLGFTLAFGALLGDLVASFWKRRAGLERGRKLPVIDQLDFIIGAVALSSIIYFPGIETVLFLLIVTPALHLAINFVGYKLRCKNVPW